MKSYESDGEHFYDRTDTQPKSEIRKGLSASKVIGSVIDEHFRAGRGDISPSELIVRYGLPNTVLGVRPRFNERDKDRHPERGYLLRTDVRVPSLSGGMEARYTMAAVDVPAGTQFSLL